MIRKIFDLNNIDKNNTNNHDSFQKELTNQMNSIETILFLQFGFSITAMANNIYNNMTSELIYDIINILKKDLNELWYAPYFEKNLHTKYSQKKENVFNILMAIARTDEMKNNIEETILNIEKEIKNGKDINELKTDFSSQYIDKFIEILTSISHRTHKCYYEESSYEKSLILDVYANICDLLNSTQENSLNKYGEKFLFLKKEVKNNYEEENAVSHLESNKTVSSANEFSKNLYNEKTPNDLSPTLSNKSKFFKDNQEKLKSDYLYKHVISKSNINGKFKFSSFAQFLIFYYYNKLSPDELIRKIKEATTINQLIKIIKDYNETYNYICEIIRYQFDDDDDNDTYEAICSILEFKTILPLHILFYNIDNLWILNNYDISDSLLDTIALTLTLPSSIDYPSYFEYAKIALSDGCVTLKYDIDHNKEKENLSTNITEWSKSLKKSIVLFNNIIYPLVSKIFFSVFYKITEKTLNKQEKESSTKDVLMDMKLKIEDHLDYNQFDYDSSTPLYESDMDIFSDGNLRNYDFFENIPFDKLKNFLLESLGAFILNIDARTKPEINASTFTLLYKRYEELPDVEKMVKYQKIEKMRSETTANFIDNAFDFEYIKADHLLEEIRDNIINNLHLH
ncbi:MAG: hypothetical protein IJ583_07165 [Firmicutes bacterium]|nr:hypothetical protein [Bacillota bacterium]